MVSPSSNLKVILNENGAAILDIRQGSISTLNPTGAYVWQELERGESVEIIVANLARDTGADPLLVGRDVCDFIKDLKQGHLLSR